MMSIQFAVSLGVLVLLGLSYYLRRHSSRPPIPFTLLWSLLLTTFVTVLSVGLLQVHFDCMFLWGECYAHGYPNWVRTAKPLLLWSPTLWSLLAIGFAANNFWKFVSERRHDRNN